MAKKSEKNSIIEICPIRNVVARFGNKWALLVILILSENGSTRFNQLGKLIPDISTKMLAGTLHTLVPIIRQLTDWALQNMKSIVAHRRKFEADGK